MKRAKEIVILSGKGGTGKTTLAATLSKLFNNKVIVDADVDAADMFILLKPEKKRIEDFKGKSIAIIRQEKCTKCGICKKLCRFDAISFDDNQYKINPYLCDGCTLCEIACPVDAIYMEQQVVGQWYISDTEYGNMVHSTLYPGAENSGNLVTMVKHQAQLVAQDNNVKYLVVDGPPGIGCPVTSSLSGATLSILVTEPTYSGIHDLKRVYEISKHFKVPATIVINKYDLNIDHSKEIEEFAKDNNITIIGKIPFDKSIVEAQINLKTPYEYEYCSQEIKKEFFQIYLNIVKILEDLS